MTTTDTRTLPAPRGPCLHCSDLVADLAAQLAAAEARLTIADEIIRTAKTESECSTIEDWRRKAMSYEYSWRCCSASANKRAGDLTAQLAAVTAERARAVQQHESAASKLWDAEQSIIALKAERDRLREAAQKLFDFADRREHVTHPSELGLQAGCVHCAVDRLRAALEGG